MGNWQLEVLKMAVYMSFPVGLFYYFNQPEYFEDWMVKTRRELYPPEDDKNKRLLREMIKEHNKRQQNE